MGVWASIRLLSGSRHRQWLDHTGVLLWLNAMLFILLKCNYQKILLII